MELIFSADETTRWTKAGPQCSVRLTFSNLIVGLMHPKSFINFFSASGKWMRQRCWLSLGGFGTMNHFLSFCCNRGQGITKMCTFTSATSVREILLIVLRYVSLSLLLYLCSIIFTLCCKIYAIPEMTEYVFMHVSTRQNAHLFEKSLEPLLTRHIRRKTIEVVLQYRHQVYVYLAPVAKVHKQRPGRPTLPHCQLKNMHAQSSKTDVTVLEVTQVSIVDELSAKQKWKQVLFFFTFTTSHDVAVILDPTLPYGIHHIWKSNM